MSRRECWASCLIIVLIPAVIFTPREGLRESLLDLTQRISTVFTIHIDSRSWSVIAAICFIALAGLIYLVAAVVVRQVLGQWINDHQSGYLKGSGNMPETQQGDSVKKMTYTGYNQHEPVRDTGPIRTEEQEKLIDGQSGEENK